MSLPMPPNTTCDIYRSGNAPPTAPDVKAVPCVLTAAYAGGLEADEDATEFSHKFTHVLLVDVATDIRDAYNQGVVGATADAVYVPDQNGTSFRVVFVERQQRGAAQDHKRVYVRRILPTWPTNEL